MIADDKDEGKRLGCVWTKTLALDFLACAFLHLTLESQIAELLCPSSLLQLRVSGLSAALAG